ncbi:MAG: cobyrinate a,c-diamide synthase [Victivallales bacterium]|nr:cobyrinate a,c-diamide synthase [Victivallales bacterium]
MMLPNNPSTFILAGTNSGAGKTTLALALLRAFALRGLHVAPFKCGPDYIDPLFHSQASHNISYNLDSWLGTIPAFYQYAPNADVALVEGVMGLFDGIRPGSLEGSTAEVAAQLELPVVLVVNARGMSSSIAPLVKGFAEWNSKVHVAGVIANNVGSEHHAKLLKEALSQSQLPPLLGYLLRNERWTLPERHLGLSVGKLLEEWLDALGTEAARTIDLDALLSLRPQRPLSCPSSRVFPSPRLRLGVAWDEAFCFYYQENFDLLRERGVKPVFFSPLKDTALPEQLDGLYFGGGYPELYAGKLSRNHTLLQQIRDFAKSHLVYGECGGYLYLLQNLVDFDGNTFPLLGLLPGTARMNQRLSSLGYRTVTGPWGTIRGHEFHYSSLDTDGTSSPLWHARDARGREWDCGCTSARVKGSYIHLHFASAPQALDAFVQELDS